MLFGWDRRSKCFLGYLDEGKEMSNYIISHSYYFCKERNLKDWEKEGNQKRWIFYEAFNGETDKGIVVN